MDYGSRGRYSNTKATEIIPEAFKNDYQACNMDPTSDPISNTREQTPIKNPSAPPQTDSQVSETKSKSRAIGKMFFKTRLCYKFRAGTCPYTTNCNYAHGMEELRAPPPKWQEIVAADEKSAEMREEHQIPTLTVDTAVGEGQRPRKKGRYCKNFFTEEGCPYGDMCFYLHDEQSEARESVARTLSPSFGNSGYVAGENGANQKPSNWKTKICTNWEMAGLCPFGSTCLFAHGVAELHKHGGGLVEKDGEDKALVATDSKQASKPLIDATRSSNVSTAHQNILHVGVASQKATIKPMQGQITRRRWKGPDKISLIYGDWPYDFE